MYRERASQLEGAVLWTRTSDGGGRILPDGCMDIIWSCGTLSIAGPDTRAHMVGAIGAATGLRFGPGIGPLLLSVPAHEMRDQRVPLDAVWAQPKVRRLAEQMAEAGSPGRMLEAVAAARLRQAGPPPPSLAGVVAGLRAGATVSSVAESVGLGARQLHRRCLIAFGYGPKVLVRILRMNRAVDLARSGTPFAEVAASVGYADQAHLAREVKALAGVPLGELVRSGPRPAHPAGPAQPAHKAANRSTVLPSGSWTAA